MKYVDEFRDGRICQQLLDKIKQTATKRWSIMEVCGGQTHGLLRYGIVQELSEVINLIHGPGCPVCVTPTAAIDFAIELAHQPKIELISFGDMLRVPGTLKSLLDARSLGASVRMVYSPLDAIQIARENPEKEIVFFAVGFETTIPATAIAVRQAHKLQLKNFSVINAHVRVLPAMELLAEHPESQIEAFLAAGHVCTVTGFQDYQALVDRIQIPIVVTGFEPVDLLFGILHCVQQLESEVAQLENCYSRTVTAEGNTKALQLVEEVFDYADMEWRGIGKIKLGGFCFTKEFEPFDAKLKFPLSSESTLTPILCRSGEVLSGTIKPIECQFFGKECRPETPLGAPMVSSEGACAAYYQYTKLAIEQAKA